MENPVALNVSGNFPLATTQWVGLTETDSNKCPASCLLWVENELASILGMIMRITLNLDMVMTIKMDLVICHYISYSLK